MPELETIVNVGSESLNSLRLLCLLAYLDVELLPESVWTKDPRFQSDALRKCFSDDSSIDHLLQPLIRSGFIHHSKALERPYICIRNTILRTTRKIIEGSVDVTPNALQQLSIKERSASYWIQRASELIYIAYAETPTDREVLASAGMRTYAFAVRFELPTAELMELKKWIMDDMLFWGHYDVVRQWLESVLGIQEGIFWDRQCQARRCGQ